MKGMEERYEVVYSDNWSDDWNMVLDAMGDMLRSLILHSCYTLLYVFRERLVLN
ncbi:hypothetical protein GIHI108528_14295 [Gillisia hiemivivida]